MDKGTLIIFPRVVRVAVVVEGRVDGLGSLREERMGILREMADVRVRREKRVVVAVRRIFAVC